MARLGLARRTRRLRGPGDRVLGPIAWVVRSDVEGAAVGAGRVGFTVPLDPAVTAHAPA